MTQRPELLGFRTLRGKFLAAVVPFLLLATAVVFGISEFTARREADETLRRKLEDLMAIQTAVLAESMWNVADQQIALILRALANDPDVLGAVVYDESGNKISAIGPSGDLKGAEFFAEGDVSYGDGSDRETIGRLAIALTSERIKAESQNRLLLSASLALLFVLSVITIALIGNRRTIGLPLERLLQSINRFRSSGQRTKVDWNSQDEIGEVVSAFNEMQVRQEAYETELREARDHLEGRVEERTRELAEKSKALVRVSNQLAKYLPPQVYGSIISGEKEVRVASSRKKLTVFFSDIAGFTEFADRLESEELTQLVNHYLTEMSQIAVRYGATIDKYMGDGIMIFFGDPETKGAKEDALSCVEMAIEMRERMHALADFWRESGVENPLRVRMGIHTGFCTVGNFGSEDRMDYTIIGGGANTASRLESAAAPGEILISYETYAHVKDRILCTEEGQIEVKGIAYPVATYRVVDSYTNLGIRQRHFHENHPNIKIDVNLDAMNTDDRSRAAGILREALSLLSDTETSEVPGPSRATGRGRP